MASPGAGLSNSAQAEVGHISYIWDQFHRSISASDFILLFNAHLICPHRWAYGFFKLDYKDTTEVAENGWRNGPGVTQQHALSVVQSDAESRENCKQGACGKLRENSGSDGNCMQVATSHVEDPSLHAGPAQGNASILEWPTRDRLTQWLRSSIRENLFAALRFLCCVSV